MKCFMMLAFLGMAGNVDGKVLIDEKFSTTFSDYGKLDEMLECTPGFDGLYASADIIKLRNHTIELGLDVGSKPFIARHMPAKYDDSGASRKRPYADGCQPAIDAIKKAASASNLFEVEVHRRVEKTVENESRVMRNVDGSVQGVSWYAVERILEFLDVEIAGIKFQLYQVANGSAKPL